MGRYREIVAALVRHGNMAARSQFTRNEIHPGLCLTHQEWQVLEYIIEHETDDETMTQISERLAIPQSSFSKISKMLFEEKLIARYRVFGNRKNIVLKATPYGKEVYESYSQIIMTNVFQAFFENLNDISDADLAKLAHAIEELDQSVSNATEKDVKRELIEIDS
jgi:DNA-binding MarR family transcriptional regulator